MPIDFHTWVSRQANSIEDKSEFIKPTALSVQSLSNIQKRMLIADMLCPSPKTEDEIQDWITALCISQFGTKGSKENTQEYLRSVIPDRLATEYLNSDGDHDSYLFYLKLRKKIEEDNLWG